MRLKRRHFVYAAGAAIAGFALATYATVMPIKTSLRALQSDAQTLQITDRRGTPLTITYQNRWNTYDNLPLYAVPEFLQKAFVVSEDKRFFDHSGVDWQARGSALVQNWKSQRTVRGASTITEQVARMINPRPRNIWSKWVEGIEAALLESNYSKAEIFEFYLNQLPYASNRRGIAQAARYYFDRDISTLTQKEMLALVVLARAPSSYDLYKNSEKITSLVNRLAENLQQQGILPPEGLAQIKSESLALERPSLPANAGHFASYVREHAQMTGASLQSTLDDALQSRVQAIIDERVKGLSRRNLHNAAVLVADHTNGDILAWVVAGANDENTPAREINAVVTPRQPGSALKPFLYAAALDNGWTPATLLNDAPLSEAIGSGLHNFKNYSNVHYGKVPLREALANSLNIPALLTINHVGTQKYLTLLHQLGFSSLDRGAEIYDEGLALGNGEVTLFELVQAYASLANRGTFRPLRTVASDDAREEKQIYKPETASQIGNILSDNWARRLEFGNGSVLHLPVQTAVKTGTSTDYRDAWAVGYNSRYVVGIWMGNLSHEPTDGVTGATGPALALRGIFSELNKSTKPEPLWLSPRLVQKEICVDDPHDASRCYPRSEFFRPGTETAAPAASGGQYLEVTKPTDGLQMAMDPRIPVERQKLPFTLKGLRPEQSVEWILNGDHIAASKDTYLWPMHRGTYRLVVRVKEGDKIVRTLPEISYIVK